MSESLQHIAIIMDGNGRWAKKQNKERSFGHRIGADSAREIITHCRALNISYLTLYAFSKENWARPKDEISTLFSLLTEFLTKELQTLLKNDICLKLIGTFDNLPITTKTALKYACEKTKNCTGMVLNLALDYSSRNEIFLATQKFALLEKEKQTEENFQNLFFTAHQIDPDLLIRTGGEKRLSNFLLYQLAYTELYFSDTFWPDFTPNELDEIIKKFYQRQRRFGKIPE